MMTAHDYTYGLLQVFVWENLPDIFLDYGSMQYMMEPMLILRIFQMICQ